MLTNINPASWSQAWGSPNAAVAGGPAFNSIVMDINFLGPFQDGAGWDWAAYHNGNFLGNGSWQIVNGGFTPGQSDFGIDGKPVPEPATWIALIAGIGVLGVVRMRG